MTNPYAPPRESDSPRPTEESWFTRHQVLGLLVLGAVSGFISDYVSSTFRATTPLQPMAPVAVAVTCRAWFCRDGQQLLVSGMVIPSTAIWASVVAMSMRVGFPGLDWSHVLVAHVIIPAILIIAGWPVMLLGRRVRSSTEPSEAGP